jgi:hypothetical protein
VAAIGAGRDSFVRKVFGHYRILAKLGGGGMGSVYDHCVRNIALKFLPGDLAKDPRVRARCTLVLPGKSSTTEIPFDKRAQMCGVSALFNREEHLTNPGMSVISPGNKAFKKSSCTRRQHFLEPLDFLPEWTCLPPSSRRRTATSWKCSCSCAWLNGSPAVRRRHGTHGEHITSTISLN